VGTVAERLDPRLPAAAQSDRLALRQDRVAVRVEELEVAADQERAVPVGDDRDSVAADRGDALRATRWWCASNHRSGNLIGSPHELFLVDARGVERNDTVRLAGSQRTMRD
jgi:hypothetical protein